MTEIRVAVASSDGTYINQHFGKATQFYIFDINQAGGTLVEVRDNTTRICDPNCEDGHREALISSTIDLIADCSYVLVAQIGFGPTVQLKGRGLTPFEVPGAIDAALVKLSSRIRTGFFEALISQTLGDSR